MMSTPTTRPKIGFIGLGLMGQPMALNMAKAGYDLIVWNRSPAAAVPLRAVGARVADSAEQVFAEASIVIAMLINDAALDEVLKRGTPAFAPLVAGRTLISMGSTPPSYTRDLAKEVQAAGGRFVEAPVSGSRKPAEAGELVILLGGDPATVADVRPLMTPMSRATVVCGPVGAGMMMKLAINLYLNTMVAALGEAVNFAAHNGLDLAALQTAFEAGPMASDVLRVKLPKMVNRDFAPQAAIADVFNNTRLIADAARAANVATPLLDVAKTLYGETVTLGAARDDMAAILTAFEARTTQAT